MNNKINLYSIYSQIIKGMCSIFSSLHDHEKYNDTLVTCIKMTRLLMSLNEGFKDTVYSMS